MYVIDNTIHNSFSYQLNCAIYPTSEGAGFLHISCNITSVMTTTCHEIDKYLSITWDIMTLIKYTIIENITLL